jgi:predicted TIM-barrel fold metal-dependent hydrolase
MMKPPFGVIDADGHINEPETRLREYLEGPYADFKSFHPYIPNREGHVGGTPLIIQGYMDSTLGARLGTHGPPGFPTPQEWLDTADMGGMETMFLFPSTLLPFSAVIDPDYQLALARAYNNYVHDDWLKFSPRFQSVSLIPFMDINESIKEMRRTISELGYRGVFLAGTGFGLLGEKKNDPFYAEAERLGTFIAVHGGHATAENQRYTKFIQRHTIGFPVSAMMQIMHMTYEGVFEKFPNLRVGYLEAGCTWVPYMLNRMDEEWEKRGRYETPNCKKRPSEYIGGGRVYVHAEAGEDLIPETIKLMGCNRLFYASDWPHWDHEYPESLFHLWGREDLTEKQKKAILRDNALEMYGLKSDK